MKIKDYISQSIQQYPSLYKDVDYEKSKLKVLDHIFGTIGTGLEFAETENPEEGGYITYPKHKYNKKTGEYIRLKDAPYDRETFKEIPEDYFNSDIYYVSGMNKPLDIVEKNGNYYFRFEKTDGIFGKPLLMKADNTYPFSPYPFSKGYSIACKVFYDDCFLQKDWMDELIIWAKRALEYFNDEEQYKTDSYYPTEAKSKSDLQHFEARFKESGIEGVKHLREIWGYKSGDSVPTVDEINDRQQEAWNNYIEKQKNFLNDFLNKFDK